MVDSEVFPTMTRGEKFPKLGSNALLWRLPFGHADMPTCPAGDIKGESKLQLKRSKTQDQTAGQVPQRKKCSRHLTTLTSFPSYTSFVLTSARETNSIKFNQIHSNSSMLQQRWPVRPPAAAELQPFSPSALPVTTFVQAAPISSKLQPLTHWLRL